MHILYTHVIQTGSHFR